MYYDVMKSYLTRVGDIEIRMTISHWKKCLLCKKNKWIPHYTV